MPHIPGIVTVNMDNMAYQHVFFIYHGNTDDTAFQHLLSYMLKSVCCVWYEIEGGVVIDI